MNGWNGRCVFGKARASWGEMGWGWGATVSSSAQCGVCTTWTLFCLVGGMMQQMPAYELSTSHYELSTHRMIQSIKSASRREARGCGGGGGGV